jgi:hypothetical protein
MDNDRPSLDLKHFEDICPDKNGKSKHNLMNARDRHQGYFLVPVIAVFTKYDQFRRNIMMKLEDQGHGTSPGLLNAEVENIFNGRYLANLTGSPPVVRLESEGFVNEISCTMLIPVSQE